MFRPVFLANIGRILDAAAFFAILGQFPRVPGKPPFVQVPYPIAAFGRNRPSIKDFDPVY